VLEGKEEYLNNPPVIPALGQPVPRSYEDILKLFHSSIVELRFERRKKIKNGKVGHLKDTRRMLCTADWGLISNVFARRLFDWKSPNKNRGKMWYKKRNLIIVWDFMKDDFRMISLDDWKPIAVFKTTSYFSRVAFMIYYKQVISKLPDNRRNSFSDK